MEILIGIYLGSTVYSWYSGLKFITEMNNRLEKDGYVRVQKESDLVGKVAGAALLSFPIVNFAVPFLTKVNDLTYEKYKQQLLDDGEIVKKEEQEENKELKETVYLIYGNTKKEINKVLKETKKVYKRKYAEYTDSYKKKGKYSSKKKVKKLKKQY